MKTPKQILPLLAIFCISFFHIGCDDFFETTLEIDPPEHNPRLVLVLDANARDDEFFIRLAKTSGWTDPLNRFTNGMVDDLEILHDGIVEVTLNGVPQNVIHRDTLFFSHSFIKEGGLNSGDVVTVKAKYDGYKDVSATAIVPPPLNLFSIRVTDTLNLEAGSGNDYAIDFQFYPAENAFASLSFKTKAVIVRGMDTIVWVERIYDISVYDPEILVYRDHAYFNSNSFLNQEKVIKATVLSNNWATENFSIVATLRSYSLDGYEFLTSLALAQQTNGNPFTTPVNVKSNVENGLGYVGFYIESVVEF